MYFTHRKIWYLSLTEIGFGRRNGHERTHNKKTTINRNWILTQKLTNGSNHKTYIICTKEKNSPHPEENDFKKRRWEKEIYVKEWSSCFVFYFHIASPTMQCAYPDSRISQFCMIWNSGSLSKPKHLASIMEMPVLLFWPPKVHRDHSSDTISNLSISMKSLKSSP